LVDEPFPNTYFNFDIEWKVLTKSKLLAYLSALYL
jgi:hypothetical protein